jgi:putative FmdB family regulatory protein
MPTYDYECQKCGHRFEEFQSMTAKLLTRCPQCKGKLKRLIGAGAGFLFKGSGFYTTDYRSSSYQEKKKGDSAPKGEAAKGDAAKDTSAKSEGSAKPAAPAAKPAPGAKSEGKPASRKSKE